MTALSVICIGKIQHDINPDLEKKQKICMTNEFFNNIFNEAFQILKDNLTQNHIQDLKKLYNNKDIESQDAYCINYINNEIKDLGFSNLIDPNQNFNFSNNLRRKAYESYSH